MSLSRFLSLFSVFFILLKHFGLELGKTDNRKFNLHPWGHDNDIRILKKRVLEKIKQNE